MQGIRKGCNRRVMVFDSKKLSQMKLKETSAGNFGVEVVGFAELSVPGL